MKRTRESDPAAPANKRQVPETFQGLRPTYRFFLIWKDSQNNAHERPVRCLLDSGSTTFAISKEKCNLFGIPTLQREKAWTSYDASGRKFEDEGKTRTYPLRLGFGNHCSDEVMEVMTLGSDIDIIIPYWWMAKHKCTGLYEGTLRFNHCPSTCFQQLSTEWSITYDKNLLNEEGVYTIGAIGGRTIPLKELLPMQYHQYLQIFEEAQSTRLPSQTKYDHAIHLQPGTEPKWGPVYRLSQEEFKALKEYVEKMIREGKIRPSSSPAGSPILFVPKAGGRGLRLCVDYRDLNKITVKDRTPLPIMDQLAEQVKGSNYFTKLDLKAGYHLIRIAEGDKWKTAFRCPLGHYEYLVMPFGLCNAPATFQRMMHDLLRHLLGNGVVNFMDDIMIHTKGTIETHA